MSRTHRVITGVWSLLVETNQATRLCTSTLHVQNQSENQQTDFASSYKLHMYTCRLAVCDLQVVSGPNMLYGNAVQHLL